MQNLTPEEVCQKFDDAWSRNDVEALVSLYAPDATLESPLISHVLGREEGVCRGQVEIRSLLLKVMQSRQNTPRPADGRSRWGEHSTPIVSGNMVIIEYPRTIGESQQPDYVDVMEIRSGRIQSLRAYWGWAALRALGAKPSTARSRSGPIV